ATKEDKAEETTRKLDTRWFISPLLKFQFQDFAMLEKNRKGYLSDANTLPFFKRGNASFAASAYKNLTQRLSISADLGLSFGHVTNDNVLISQTKSKTFNLLNAALYYHLLAPSYRLQPYVTVGINDVINDASYASIPMGIGAKFNARKVMVTGQITYGYAMGKSISNTTMYSVGIYLPIKNKKQKQLDQEDNSPYNRKKDDKKDTANKNNGSVVNNIFITINMDSVLKAKGLLDDNGNPIGGRGVNDGDDDGRGGGGSRAKRARPFRSMGLDDFSDDDYKIDSLDGRPVLRFVVYFEFNEYGLTTKAFNNIDKVIGHLRKTTEFNVEIKGYTDSIGTNAYNNMLSRRRAKMVLDYMNSRGVPTELMKAKAYGSDDPVGDNRDPNQAWLNRRAEIIIHQKEFTASTAAEK
ncbi:MAG TPA: OmpA family protein, partial [Puia sp.]|nr:OmpA family protein [Puia sp.]